MAENTNTNDNVNATPPAEEAKKVVKGNGSGGKVSASAANPADTLTITPTATTSDTPKRLQPSPAPEPPKGKVVTDPDNIYVFIGSESQIGTTRLSGYGMQIRITDPATLEDVVAGGVGLVPKSAWDKAGFTDEELEKYSEVTTHNPEDADIEFLRKVVAMRKAYQDFAMPIIETRQYNTHLDSLKRAEASGIARREKEAAYHRLLQEYNPAHVMPTKISPRDMLVNPVSANNDFEPMATVVEVVSK